MSPAWDSVCAGLNSGCLLDRTDYSASCKHPLSVCVSTDLIRSLCYWMDASLLPATSQLDIFRGYEVESDVSGCTKIGPHIEGYRNQTNFVAQKMAASFNSPVNLPEIKVQLQTNCNRNGFSFLSTLIHSEITYQKSLEINKSLDVKP